MLRLDRAVGVVRYLWDWDGLGGVEGGAGLHFRHLTILQHRQRSDRAARTGVGGIGKWGGPSSGGRMAALRIFRAGDRVILIGFSYFWVRLWFLCILCVLWLFGG